MRWGLSFSFSLEARSSENSQLFCFLKRQTIYSKSLVWTIVNIYSQFLIRSHSSLRPRSQISPGQVTRLIIVFLITLSLGKIIFYRTSVKTFAGNKYSKFSKFKILASQNSRKKKTLICVKFNPFWSYSTIHNFGKIQRFIPTPGEPLLNPGVPPRSSSSSLMTSDYPDDINWCLQSQFSFFFVFS